MSLKSFHLVFLVASVVLALFLAAFGFDQYRQSGSQAALLGAISSALAAVTLVIYGRYFLRKLRHISYL